MTDSIDGYDALSKTLEERAALANTIIQALSQYPRDRAMAVIISWFSTQDLRDIIPTLAKPQEGLPTELDALKAYTQRLGAAFTARGLVFPPARRIVERLHDTPEKRAEDTVRALWEAR